MPARRGVMPVTGGLAARAAQSILFAASSVAMCPIPVLRGRP